MLKEKLDALKSENRYRSLKRPSGIDFSSNDYLGLRQSEIIKNAAQKALDNAIDFGSGGSRLLRGHHEQHEALENFAAQFFGFEKALYFGCGFQANTALFQTLPARGDVILYDALIHASARDGIKNSNAKSYKFAHNDLNALEDLLRRYAGHAGHIWVAVESLYSMDGDYARLQDIQNIAQQFDASLVVDEAHTTGISGPDGRGASHNLARENLIVLHTCGKALGLSGGILCASEDVIDYMINAARPFIYSTAPSPFQAFMVQQILQKLGSDDLESRRKALSTISKKAQQIFGGAGSHIVPVILGDEGTAITAAKILQEGGYDIRAIRPPSVPAGTSRLRLSLCANADPDDLPKIFEIIRPFMLENAA